MTGAAPGPQDPESSSSSRPRHNNQVSPNSLDLDDQADLSLDNALLADDPLDEFAGNNP